MEGIRDSHGDGMGGGGEGGSACAEHLNLWGMAVERRTDELNRESAQGGEMVEFG